MRNEIRGIAVDNGGSEVRVMDGMNPVLEDMIKLKNDFVSIKEKDFRVKEVAEPAKLCRVLEAPNPDFMGIFAQGLTGKSYEGQVVAISSQKEKTADPNYYKQFIFAVAQDALKAWIQSGGYSMYSNGNSESQQHPDIADSYDYCIVACIPIQEFSGAKDCAGLLKNTLQGHYVVEFPLLDKKPVISFNIKAEFMGAAPEGGIAVKALKDQLEEDDISLLVDMGCVTTDIALFQGTHLLGRVSSVKFASSTLVANIRAVLADEGYFVSEAQAENVLIAKRVKDGHESVDVSAIVEEQSRNFVRNYLQNEIIGILNANHVNARQVQNFVPIGASFNNPESNALISEIIACADLQKAKLCILADDLRYVNIQQASRFVKKFVKRAKA